MYCHKCGTQLPDNSKFCSNCGAQFSNVQPAIQPVANSFNITAKKLDTNTIVCLVLAVIMVLSMLVLPMFIEESSQTISLLGDNYMYNKNLQTTINMLSKIAFIFMLATTAATVVFRIVKKTLYSFISSCVNGGILLLYIGSFLDAWMTKYPKAPITLGAGTILCLGCSIALFVLSFLEFRKEKENNPPKSPTPPQPMIFR